MVNGFQWVDPFTAFGEISGWVLAGSVILIIGFFISGIFIYLYYKKFYEVTEAPKGWKFFFMGLILSGLYHLLKIPFTYKWIYGDIFTLLFLVFQVIVVVILIYGLYLLKKSIQLV